MKPPCLETSRSSADSRTNRKLRVSLDPSRPRRWIRSQRTLSAVPLIVPVLGKHLDVNALLEILDGLAALARCFQTP